jgi:hypothetical protein
MLSRGNMSRLRRPSSLLLRGDATPLGGLHRRPRDKKKKKYCKTGLQKKLKLFIQIAAFVGIFGTSMDTLNTLPGEKVRSLNLHQRLLRQLKEPGGLQEWIDNGEPSSLKFSSTPAPSMKSAMIIATKPTSELKFASIWSHLECFTEKIDKIIISNAKDNFEDDLSAFVDKVKERMPEIGSKIEVQNHINDRYDAGLWCDALTEGLSEEYDHFFLINDSVMAIEPLNEVLDTLTRNKADLVSLNYWGDKKDFYETYWLESPIRAFSKKGIQAYSDNVCNLGKIRWQLDCPHLKNSRYTNNREKRCIVEKTEIAVAKYLPQDKVDGLYYGNDGSGNHWSSNLAYWYKLRDEHFPVVKNSNKKMFERIRRERPQDLTRCTTKYNNWFSEKVM